MCVNWQNKWLKYNQKEQFNVNMILLVDAKCRRFKLQNQKEKNQTILGHFCAFASTKIKYVSTYLIKKKKKGWQRNSPGLLTWIKKSFGFPTRVLQRRPLKGLVRFSSNSYPSVPKITPSSP